MAEPAPELIEAAGPVTWLTLNRPRKRNALDPALISALTAALDRADLDPAVHVVAITGAGEDFCAGADLAALRDLLDAPTLENLADAENLGRLFLRIRSLRKPVVAVVRGRALAGGCGLATACDLVLAADTATFGYPEVKLGFVPALVMAILSRNVTEKRAFELIVTGETFPAADFERFGLINRIFPEARLAAESDRFLAALASADPSAHWLSKRLLYRQRDMSFEAAMQAGAEVNTIARTTDVLREGVSRFLKERGGGNV